MTKKRSKTTDFAIYLVIRFIVCMIQLLSYETARKLRSFVAKYSHFVTQSCHLAEFALSTALHEATRAARH